MHGWTPNLGSMWQHYKGNKYVVLGFAACEKTGQTLVLYSEYGKRKTWARPLTEWTEIVLNDQNYPVLRFEAATE